LRRATFFPATKTFVGKLSVVTRGYQGTSTVRAKKAWNRLGFFTVTSAAGSPAADEFSRGWSDSRRAAVVAARRRLWS